MRMANYLVLLGLIATLVQCARGNGDPDSPLELNETDNSIKLNGTDNSLKLNGTDNSLKLNGTDNSLKLNGTANSSKLNETDSPCIFSEENVNAVCIPCDKEKWINLVKPDGGGEEKIINEKKTCFNSDPIKLHRGDPSSEEDDKVVMSQGEYRTIDIKKPHDFYAYKSAFLRYAYSTETKGGSGSEEGVPSGPDTYLDMGAVKKYFFRKNSNGENMDADVQLIEWPGQTSEELIKGLEEQSVALIPERCSSALELQGAEPCEPQKYYMLELQRDNGKILFYSCNAQEGTNIVAVGGLSKVDSSKINPEVESKQKLWLSHGRRSIYDHYVEPLALPKIILEEMAKTEGDSCRAEGNYEDLRTVRDFAFTNQRLVLGMKCGIVLVSTLSTDNLTFSVASLKDESGEGTNLFPTEINRLTAGICCPGEQCHHELVVAYSFTGKAEPDDNVFFYVSFDSGNTFHKKIAATEHSPVNLIKGLFQLYQKWGDYYDILNNPDKDDLDEDDESLRNVRKKSIWDAATLVDKEKMLSAGVKPEKRKKESLKKVIDLIENRVPKRRDRLRDQGVDVDSDQAPEWVNFFMNKTRIQAGWNESWTDDTCDDIPDCKEKFENDKAVDWLLEGSDIHVKSPKRAEHEPFCKNILSILILPEESHVMALCEIGYEQSDGAAMGGEEGEGSGHRRRRSETSGEGDNVKYLALFNYPVKENIPLVYNYRVSKRIFSCNFIRNPDKDTFVEPSILRIPGSAVIFVINCKGIVYLSTNFGNTIFNAAFYYNKNIVEEYCKQDPSYTEEKVEPCLEKDKESKDGTEAAKYIRSYHLCALDVPPLVTADRSATVLLITFGRFYARGAIAYNREMRLVVGETMKDLPYERRFENIIFPGTNSKGETVLAAALNKVYSIPDTPFKSLYEIRPSIRLVQMPVQSYDDLKHFHTENLAMCQFPLSKGFGFPVCKTFSFSVKPTEVKMDLGETRQVNVKVRDDQSDLPLWIFSSNEKSVEVKAFQDTKDSHPNISSLSYHNWLLEIKTTPNPKSEEEALVDSFFGWEYSQLYDHSVQIALVNTPTGRCHVQPSSIVTVNIGCRDTIMRAHEDVHRPQCSQFRKNFNYTLKKGDYDPELADYWLEQNSHQKTPFVKLLPNGDLSIIYDYASWGCPIEPFRADEWIPDLRILDTKVTTDTAKGARFTGKFILIELFGAHGYSYTKTAKEYIRNCKRAPQSMKEMVHQWKLRQRLMFLASSRLKFPNSTEDVENIDMEMNITGNKMFMNEAVTEHLNIWNRGNFLRCENYFDGEIHNESNIHFSKEILERPYEIMTTSMLESDQEAYDSSLDHLSHEHFRQQAEKQTEDHLNKISWSIKDHQRVYVFLAVAVDELNSHCGFHTVFGVSLRKTSDMDDLTSFIIFLLFTSSWLLLIAGSYFVRKRLLRFHYMQQARAERLEQAAWKIVYRYEKLIHGRALNTYLMNKHTYDEDTELDLHNKANAAKSAYDKRRAELRMKKTHLMVQEQARYEKLTKTFQKQ